MVAISLLVTALAVVMIVVVLVLDSFGVIGKRNNQSKTVSVGLVAPQALEQGASAKWQVTVNNNTRKKVTVIVKLIAQGVNLGPINENNPSTTVVSSEQVAENFGGDWGKNDELDWRPSQIAKGKSISLDFIGLPTLSSGETGKVKAIVYQLNEEGKRCKFLWLAKCNIHISENKLAETEASEVVTAVNQRRDAVTLGKGFNLVSLPVTINTATAGRFWSQFTTPLGWHLDSATQAWHNTTESQYYADLKPGNGMWLYHPDGGEILIPDGDAVNSDANFELKLSTGWNQIGNPYKYRIKLDGDRILVKRSGKDTITLGGVAEEGVVTKLLGVAGAESGAAGSEPTYVELVMGRYLPIGSGFFINTTEAMTLVFPGKTIFAPGELISAVEKAKIISWINSNGLDVCGNEPSSDISSNPLRDDQTGEVLDQFDCVLIKHPDRPWNK